MAIPDIYSPDPARYDGRMPQRRCGESGVSLPAVSLGFWHNFGDTTPVSTQRAIMRAAFDAGVTHFDLANNYGPPFGTAELNVGRILREDFRTLRNELIISTKAGWDMWPGPYGFNASRKYLLASLDDSLQRLGLDYVDIFYSHRPHADTPLEETMGALATAVQQGKALYAGISSYSPVPDPPCGADAGRHGRAGADPSAFVLDVQSLDRGRLAGHAWRLGSRVHRLQSVGAGDAD